jgi:MFS family permease
MAAANLLRAFAVGALALALIADVGSTPLSTRLAPSVSIGLLYLVAVVAGSAETVYDTASQSILPMLVPRERLAPANGRLFAVELSMNQFVGPPLGGALVAAGIATSAATPAGLWLLAAGTLLLIPGRFRVERTGTTTLRADIAEGVRFLMHHRVLRTLAALVGVSNLASNAAFGVLVLYAVGPSSAIGLTDPQYGALLTASAVGSVAGFLLAERIEARWGRARTLKATVVTFALLIGTPALTTNPWLIAAAFAVGGAGNGVWNVITVSLRQCLTPDVLLGRLNSAYRLLAWGTMPIGAALGGLLAQAVGLRAVFAVFGLLALTGLIGLRWITGAIDTAAADTMPADTTAADAMAAAPPDTTGMSGATGTDQSPAMPAIRDRRRSQALSSSALPVWGRRNRRTSTAMSATSQRRR